MEVRIQSEFISRTASDEMKYHPVIMERTFLRNLSVNHRISFFYKYRFLFNFWLYYYLLSSGKTQRSSPIFSISNYPPPPSAFYSVIFRLTWVFSRCSLENLLILSDFLFLLNDYLVFHCQRTSSIEFLLPHTSALGRILILIFHKTDLRVCFWLFKYFFLIFDS